jgi:succinate dehydrogenase / fumarate reductase cytochrome b subunit
VIRILEIGLFIGFLIHIIQGYVLEVQNRQRRKIGYKVKMGSEGSKWYRKSMGLLGTLILIFLVIHVSHFWIPSRVTNDLTPREYLGPNGPKVHDLFERMVNVFQEPWVIALYLIGCISLAWHLVHGFQSAFRTLGVYNKSYIGILKATGIGFSILVPLLFALMPISMYFGWVGYNN